MGGHHGCKSSISPGNQAKNLLGWLEVGSAICQNAAGSLSNLPGIIPRLEGKCEQVNPALGLGKAGKRGREMFFPLGTASDGFDAFECGVGGVANIPGLWGRS